MAFEVVDGEVGFPFCEGESFSEGVADEEGRGEAGT